MFIPPQQNSGTTRTSAFGQFLSPAEYRRSFETTLSLGRFRLMVRWFRLEQERRRSAYASSGSWGRMGRMRESFRKPMRAAALQGLAGHRTEHDTRMFWAI